MGEEVGCYKVSASHGSSSSGSGRCEHTEGQSPCRSLAVQVGPGFGWLCFETVVDSHCE